MLGGRPENAPNNHAELDPREPQPSRKNRSSDFAQFWTRFAQKWVDGRSTEPNI